MISVYKLTQAINESASGVVTNNVVAYEFIGGLEEAASEMKFVMMSEAADIAYFKANADEIMTEAAITNPSSLEVLTENVFSKIGDRIVQFLKKVESMVKGMIEKIKAFFFKLTKKTNDWARVMEPRIKEVTSNNPEAASQTIEVRKWDLTYIATEGGMASALGAMADKLAAGANEKFDLVDKAMNEFKAHKNFTMNDKSKGDDASAENVTKAIEAINTRIKNVKADDEKKKDQYLKDIASALSVSGNDMDEIWTEVTKKATGGEKVTMKYSEAANGGGVSKMFEAVKNSTAAIEALKKAYDKHLTDLTKIRSAAERAFAKDSALKDPDAYSGALKSKYQELVTECSNSAVSTVNMLESAMTTAKSRHMEFVQNMTSEYMTVLSKYSNLKPKKK